MNQIGTNKDIPIQITIKDEQGQPIDIDTFDEDIEVAVYQRRDNVIQFFKQSEGQVETIVAADGNIMIKIDRVNTAKINTLNPLYVEVVPVSADSDYEDGIRRWDATIVKLPTIVFSAI